MAEYQPTNELKITEIDEITLCEEGRNPAAVIEMLKSKEEKSVNIIKELFCGDKPIVEIAKSYYALDPKNPMSYDETRQASEAMEDVCEKIETFRTVVRGAFNAMSLDEAKKAVANSLEQFRNDLAEWASGEGMTKPTNELQEVAKQARDLMAAAERGDVAAFVPQTEVKKMSYEEWYAALDDATKKLVDDYVSSRMDMSKAADDMAKAKPAMTEAEVALRKEMDELRKQNESLMRKHKIADAVAKFSPFANVAPPAELASIAVSIESDAALSKAFETVISGASARIGSIGSEVGSGAQKSAASAGDMRKSKADYKEMPLYKSLMEKHGNREVLVSAELYELRNKGNQEAAAIIKAIP